MSLRKKATVSALVLSMLTASVGILPFSTKGPMEKLSLIRMANAAEMEQSSGSFRERLSELYAALAIDPEGLQDVINLREEITRLQFVEVQPLISPIWSKVNARLPETVDRKELREGLIHLFKTVSTIQTMSELEELRSNPEFNATLRMIAAAFGHEDLSVDDFIVFLFGDGGSRLGLEGTVASTLENMPLTQLAGLIGNRQAATEILLQAVDKLLEENDAYRISSILKEMDISSQDIRSLLTSLQGKLQYDDQAIHAMIMAYVRTTVEATAQISEDGRQHIYSLNAFGIEIPAFILQWSKVSGDAAVSVSSNGVVTIPEGAGSGSAVIQAELANPYGSGTGVIFQKEVTLRETSGEETVFPSEQFLERMNKLHAALAAGDPTDIQDVRNLRDEIAGLDPVLDEALIDPVWNKIAPKLPSTVDQAELKANLFQMIKEVGSFQYDPTASELEAIRSNPKFRSTLKTIAAAGGDSQIVMDDFLLFMFGDGGSRKGIEGTIRDLLVNMNAAELLGLLGNNEAITAVLLQATEQLLSETDEYKFSSILEKLEVTPQDLRSTVLNYQVRLQYDVPAIHAMAVAYMRSESTERVDVSEDGRQHIYSLKVFGVDVPAIALKWVKVSGSDDIEVLPNGTVTLAPRVPSASAVIQAQLFNPYGGNAKVIFEKEVTLTASTEEGNIFPVEQFLERMEKLHAALQANGSSDVRDVRRLWDEINNLNATKDAALINQIWKPIAEKLPDSVDKKEVKKNLFELITSVGSLPYDLEGSQLEAIRTNPDFVATMGIIAEAAGVSNLSIDDFLILLYGDNGEHSGVEGAIRNTISNMNSKELAAFLKNKNGLDRVKEAALEAVLSDRNGYALSEALFNLGVKPKAATSLVQNFKTRLRYDVPAVRAISAAFISSETESKAEITQNGRQHVYTLTVLGVELPSSALKWKKVSGSKDVKVTSNGKVTLDKKVQKGTAIIQATLVNLFGGNSKVIFTQEITLTNGVVDPEVQIQNIVHSLQGKLAEIKIRFDSATIDAEKVQLIMEVVQAGNDSFDRINEIDASKTVKNKAINNVKKQVNKMMDYILQNLLKF